jgi:hypothetical protein
MLLYSLKGKSWPVVFGVGVGAGMGASNCQYKLNVPFMVRADQIKVQNLNADLNAHQL